MAASRDAEAERRDEQSDQLADAISGEGNPTAASQAVANAARDPEVLKQAMQKLPLGKKAAAALRMATGVALRFAWQYLIPSFGLTLTYINLHFIIRHLAMRKSFAQFGAEWSPVKSVMDKPNIALKYGEMTALGFADLLILAIILGLITLGGMIAYAIQHPCEFIGKIGYAHAVAFAAIGGPAAQAGVVACVAVNSISG